MRLYFENGLGSFRMDLLHFEVDFCISEWVVASRMRGCLSKIPHGCPAATALLCLGQSAAVQPKDCPAEGLYLLGKRFPCVTPSAFAF
jgi:hypothetical protein